MRRTIYVLHSALDPSSVPEVLRLSIDEERRTLFSMSGYQGDRPVLGKVDGNTFILQKRRYSRNDFAGRFYERFEPEVGGTRIEGHFDSPPWAKWFMRIWLAGVILLGSPVFVMTVIDIVRGTHQMGDGRWIGLIVPPAMVLFGIILPKLGRLLGKRDEQYILDHVRNTLAARSEVTPA
ncbi:MAG: hypothetical protein ABSG40_23795 [Terriglobales bacterium]|jgi:hypothetical protein